MSNITWTHRADYPRFLATSGRKTEITTWTNSGPSWQPVWDAKVLPSCNSWAAESDSATFARGDNADEVIYLLGLAGWIDNVASYHNKLLSYGKWLEANRGNWLSWTDTGRRDQTMALAHCYNWLRTGVVTFSAADRALVGDGVADISAGASANPNEYIDGHSHGDQAAALVAGLAIAGEFGTGYDFRTVAETRINAAFDFWYGPAGTMNPSRMQTLRYFCDDGATYDGAWYGATTFWGASTLLLAMASGLVQNSETANALQLLGEDYDPLTSEAWTQKIPEFMLWAFARGDLHYWKLGNDTYRQSSSHQVRYNHRMALGWGIRHGGAFRKNAHWLRNTLHSAAEADSQVSNYDYAYEIPLWDPSASANAPPQHPKDNASLAKTKFFDVPGSFWHRNTWDTQAAVIDVEVKPWYYHGHSHLDRGAMQVSCLDDMVVCHSGKYGISTCTSAYGGRHNRAYYQQSIAHSGIPCFPAADITHTALFSTGRAACPHGGGQLFRRWWNGSSWRYDPDNLYLMQNDGGGAAWRVAEHEIVNELGATWTLLCSDITKAYQRDMSDAGTTYARVSLCHVKDLVIKGEWAWPIVLRYARAVMAPARSTQGAFVPWHSWGQWSESWPHGTSPQTGDTRRFRAAGWRGHAKCLIDLYNWQSFTIQHVGDGPNNSYGYGSQQFYYESENFSPTLSASGNYFPDLGMWRFQATCAVNASEVHWLFLVMPMAVADEPPEYSWVDVPDWYGVRFGTTAHEFRVHKTLNQAMTGQDTTPPGAPTNLQTVPGNAQVLLSCSPNSEDDMDHYRAKYRVKV